MAKESLWIEVRDIWEGDEFVHNGKQWTAAEKVYAGGAYSSGTATEKAVTSVKVREQEDPLLLYASDFIEVWRSRGG